jgi:hypothetical protein
MSGPDSACLTGGCLCGGVRYKINGKPRDIINCHCENCRRTHGHVAAYTSVPQSDLEFDCKQTLQWFHDESPDTWRGFCNRCGASLFWDARDSDDKISIAAGTLDDSGSLKTIGHVYVSEAGNYYQINDALPTFETASAGALESDESS